MTDTKKAAEREAMDENLKTWPERIWIQHGEEEVPNFDARYVGVEDMTWCHDKMDGTDVEYVRADLAALPSAQVPQDQQKTAGGAGDAGAVQALDGYRVVPNELLRQLRHYTECHRMVFPHCGAPTEAEVILMLATATSQESA